MKGWTVISGKQNLENKAFYMGFMHLKIKLKRIQTENKTYWDKNLKISSTQVMENLLSFQTQFKFLKSIHWLWRYNVWHQETFFHFAFKEKHKNWRRITL